MDEDETLRRLRELASNMEALRGKAGSAGSTAELLALLKQGADLMGQATEVSREIMTPDERAAAERYEATVVKPSGKLFADELRGVAEEHGSRAVLRVATTLLSEMITEAKSELTKKPDKG